MPALGFNGKGVLFMKKAVRIVGIVVAVLTIAYIAIRFSDNKRVVNFQMTLCSPKGDAVPFSIDAVLESSLTAPRQYTGTLHFNGMEYAAHQNAQRVSKLSVILDRLAEKLNNVTYAIFLRTGAYGVSDWIIIEDVLYNDENDTYMIWLYYHEAGAPKAEEYFGPASSAEEAEKIRDAFYEGYLLSDRISEKLVPYPEGKKNREAARIGQNRVGNLARENL